MAWNEPGQKGNPWNQNKSSSNPEEWLQNLQNKLNSLFGGNASPLSFLPVILLIFLAFGIYIIEPAERAVVLRFGKYLETMGPGPHWLIPLVDSKTVVNVDRIRSHNRQGPMLTRDENIVEINLEVQYRVKDAKPYVLATSDPDSILKQVTEGALRQVVGQTDLNDVLTTSRAVIAENTKQHLQTSLDQYQTGLQITQVNMQKSDPPAQVKEAFDDVIKAREDKVRSTNEAESYANQILPLARGEAQRIIADARAYKEHVTKRAEGEASRFNQLVVEYQKAPEVTRERLYVETIESVLNQTSKMIVDTGKSSPLFVLPMDKLSNFSKTAEELPSLESGANTISETPKKGANASASRNRDQQRQRGQ